MSIAKKVVQSALVLAEAVDELRFSEPVTHVYNPLKYAWEAQKQYLEKYAGTKKKVVFLGMNPGPWGMAQVGVPFGEVSLVRDWVGIEAEIKKPEGEHPKRPIEGFDCKRSEVSGKRLWGLFKERFGSAEVFFKEHFVANYCPLVFMEESAKNRTPENIVRSETVELFEACSRHLKEVVEILGVEWVIGVGGFAQKRALEIFKDTGVKVGLIIHPSPASPAANRGWAEKATAQLEEQGIW